MKHSEIKELVSAYADGELAPAQIEMIELHLLGCPDCQRSLAEFRLTGQQLALLAGADGITWRPDVSAAVTAQIQGRRRWLDLGQRLLLNAVKVSALIVFVVASAWLLRRLPALSPAEDNVLVSAPERITVPAVTTRPIEPSAEENGSVSVATQTSPTLVPESDESPDRESAAGHVNACIMEAKKYGTLLELCEKLIRDGDIYPYSDFTPTLAPMNATDASDEPAPIILQSPGKRIMLYLLSDEFLISPLASTALRNMGYQITTDRPGAYAVVEVVGGQQIYLLAEDKPSIYLPPNAQPGDRVRIFGATPEGEVTSAAEFTLTKQGADWLASDLREVEAVADLRLLIPTPTPKPTATPLPMFINPLIHGVQRGDTCQSVAAEHRLPVESLENLNPGKCLDQPLRVGDFLFVHFPATPMPQLPLSEREVALQVAKVYVEMLNGGPGVPFTLTAVIQSEDQQDIKAAFSAELYMFSWSNLVLNSDQFMATIPAGGRMQIDWPISDEAIEVEHLRVRIKMKGPAEWQSELLYSLPFLNQEMVSSSHIEFSPRPSSVSDACPPGDNLRIEIVQDDLDGSDASLLIDQDSNRTFLEAVVYNDGNTGLSLVPIRARFAEGGQTVSYSYSYLRWLPPCGQATVEVPLPPGQVSFPIEILLNPPGGLDTLPESDWSDNVLIISRDEDCTGETDLWLANDDVAFDGDDLLVTVHLSGEVPRRSFQVRAFHSNDGRNIAEKQVYLTSCKKWMTLRFENALVGLDGGFIMVEIDTETNHAEPIYPQNNNTASVPLPASQKQP